MKIKNLYLGDIYTILHRMPLPGKQSRMRTRFLKAIFAQLELVESEKQDLLRQYAKLDRDGEIMTKTGENGQKLVVFEGKAKQDACNDEINALMNEEFIIEENETNKEMLITLKDIVLKTESMFVRSEAEAYDALCESLESLTY